MGQSGLNELDPEFAASLETSLSWGIGLGLDAAGTAYAVGAAVYTVGEAIVQSYIDTAVGYYNAGGGGANGVLLAISGVSGGGRKRGQVQLLRQFRWPSISLVGGDPCKVAQQCFSVQFLT